MRCSGGCRKIRDDTYVLPFCISRNRKGVAIGSSRMSAGQRRWIYAQEVDGHITDDDAVWVNVPVLLEQKVESLQLSKTLGNLEQWPVLPGLWTVRWRVRFIPDLDSTHSSSVGKASHNVPPRKAVLRRKMVAILRVAFQSSLREDG